MRMETSGWLMDQQSPKVVWRFAGMNSGALFVMISGQLLMPKWPADSWDSSPQV